MNFASRGLEVLPKGGPPSASLPNPFNKDKPDSAKGNVDSHDPAKDRKDSAKTSLETLNFAKNQPEAAKVGLDTHVPAKEQPDPAKKKPEPAKSSDSPAKANSAGDIQPTAAKEQPEPAKAGHENHDAANEHPDTAKASVNSHDPASTNSAFGIHNELQKLESRGFDPVAEHDNAKKRLADAQALARSRGNIPDHVLQDLDAQAHTIISSAPKAGLGLGGITGIFGVRFVLKFVVTKLFWWLWTWVFGENHNPFSAARQTISGWEQRFDRIIHPSPHVPTEVKAANAAAFGAGVENLNSLTHEYLKFI